MTTTTLVASSAFSLVAAAIYAYVGRVISTRAVTSDARLANQMFVLWWYSLAGLTGATGLFTGAAAAGFTDLTLYETFLNAVLLLLCVALFGLAYYLIFLYTGRRGILWPLVAFYSAYYLYLVYLVATANPVGLEVGRWNTEVTYENEDALGGQSRFLLLLLLVPQILGAMAYFSLYFRVTDPTVRYRIATVSATLVAWFGSSLVASLTGVNENDWWQLVSRSVSVVAALFILMAYRPPAWVQRRLGDRAAAPGAAA